MGRKKATILVYSLIICMIEREPIDEGGLFYLQEPTDNFQVAHGLELAWVTEKKTSTKYLAYFLTKACNPTASIYEIYCSLAGDTQISGIFIEVIANQIIFNDKFARLSPSDLIELIFGDSLKKQKSEQIISDLLAQREKFKSEGLDRQQILTEVVGRYPKFVFAPSLEESQKLFNFHLWYSMCRDLRFMRRQVKMENLQYLSERLSKKGIHITQKRCKRQQKKQYEHETLIAIPEQQTLGGVSLTDYMLQVKTLHKRKPFETMTFAKILYQALLEFNELLSNNYSCLSLDNVIIHPQKKQVRLNYLSFVLHMIGVIRVPTPLRNLCKQSSGPCVEFWKPIELLQGPQDLLVNDATLMWEWLMFVDWYENDGQGFFSDAKNKQDIKQRIIDFINIVEDGKEQSFFGKTVVEVIQYFGKRDWNDCQRRPSIWDLKGFFSAERHQTTQQQ